MRRARRTPWARFGRRTASPLLGIGLLLAVLTACGEQAALPGGGGGDRGGGADATGDLGDAAPGDLDDQDSADRGSREDSGLGDLRLDLADDVATSGELGDPCRSNIDCRSGFCVPGRSGFFCTVACFEECPVVDGVATECTTVTNFGADEVRVCTPVDEVICQPCVDSRTCIGGACNTLPDGTSVCGLDCEGAGDCPEGTFCYTDLPGVGDLERAQCLPLNLTCDCSDENEGDSRPCARSNEDGSRTCVGTELCDPARGWVGCDAPAPQPEVCDGTDNDCNGAPDDGVGEGLPCELSAEGFETTCPGVSLCGGEAGMTCLGEAPSEERCDLRDNDCDGDVDEGFVDGSGRYATDAHCGVCGNDCATRFPEGYEAACVEYEGEPTCVITACPAGYAPSGPFACVPLASALCLPCLEDADCNELVGDRCLTYDDGTRACGRDCGADSVFGATCPAGYACDAERDEQCVREVGSCVCSEGDLFYLPCLVDPPALGEACLGRQLCDDGTVGACEPPEEVCDGIDNDCDGDIDEGFRGDDGVSYDTDAHCGRCFNDCTRRFDEGVHHAAGVCVEGEGEAGYACAPACLGAFVDADGLAFNGCECERLGDTDEPDTGGVDANCDGIDGEVARGVFVAPYGDDGAAGTREAPLATIGAGLAAAVPGERDHVYVSAGVYSEAVVLRAGVSLFGGYGFDFGTRDIAGNETAIVGPVPTAEAPGALTAVGIGGAVDTVVDGFTIAGADRTGPAESTYAVYVRACDERLVLRNNRVRAGDGGPGTPGDAGGVGRSASGAGFSAARDGGLPASTDGDCPASTPSLVAGGGGATFTCERYDGANVATSGGAGATVGCPTDDVAAPSGSEGQSAPGSRAGAPNRAGGPGGAGGFSHVVGHTPLLPPFCCGTCNVCFVPDGATETVEGLDGVNGVRGAPGDGGAGCSDVLGSVVGGLWVPSGGGASGNQGGPGSGGGGGGGGGGLGNAVPAACVSIVAENLGGSGAGGGAGGCGGEGGAGGGPGGGSFGVFLAEIGGSAPRIVGNVIERGRGGAGGDGGPGGVGGLGSDGGVGRDNPDVGCVGPGGNGGDGGAGGPGGGGGGGCGGPSVGIFAQGLSGAALGVLNAANEFPGVGAGGVPGRGGTSSGDCALEPPGTCTEASGASARPAVHEAVLPCPDGGAVPCE
jgi:hypothetical protein